MIDDSLALDPDDALPPPPPGGGVLQQIVMNDDANLGETEARGKRQSRGTLNLSIVSGSLAKQLFLIVASSNKKPRL